MLKPIERSLGLCQEIPIIYWYILGESDVLVRTMISYASVAGKVGEIGKSITKLGAIANIAAGRLTKNNTVGNDSDAGSLWK